MTKGNDEDDDPEKPNKPEPPKDTRFKPGVSGNPKGRPKGSIGMKAKLQRELLKMTTVKTGGKSARMAKGDVIVNQLADKAMRDPKVAALVWRLAADDSSDASSAAGAAGAGIAIPRLDRETLRRIINRARRLEEDEPDEQ